MPTEAMSNANANSPRRSPVQQELYEFIVGELVPDRADGGITADEDLIKRGIVDSLGVQQLVEFCESRYGIRVSPGDLVPRNFQTLAKLAAFIDRKQAEASPPGRLGLRSRRT
jgi:acyl carrier protein